jgi:hypothetical protein
VLQAAKERAQRENKTMGEVIADLARQSLLAPVKVSSAREPKVVYGLRPLPRRGGIIVTNQMIDKLRDDDPY